MMTTITLPTGAATVTERLADHVVGLRYEDIPGAIVEKAKTHVAHHIGTAFRGSVQENGRQAVAVARALSGAGGHCSIIGHDGKASLLDTVFANSFLMQCAGLDDFLFRAAGNPGIITNPVGWAFGETNSSSGRDLLTAVIIGYDVLGTLNDQALTFGLDGYRPAKHVLAPFAAAATAARLLGLSREKTVHALGHAGQAGRNIAGTGVHEWTMHPVLARNGGMAAMLAKAGMAASPTVIEGERGVFNTFFSRELPDFIDARLERLGHEFTIADAQIKRQPVSALNVLAIELTQQLREQHRLSPSGVAVVDVAIPEERRARETKRDEALTAPRADSTNRMGSPRFLVAMMLSDGRIDMTRLDHAPDTDFLAVLEKVRLHYEPGHPLLYTRVEITTTDGRHYAAEGDTLNILPPVDWAESLAERAQGILSDDQLTRLTDLLRHLEDVADVSEVMAYAVPRSAS